MENNKEIKTSTEIEFSEQTKQYVKLLSEVDTLWNLIYDTIEKDYGTKCVDNNFNKDFYPHLTNLQNSIYGYLTDSMRLNLVTCKGKITI